jgi:hypothetical protein
MTSSSSSLETELEKIERELEALNRINEETEDAILSKRLITADILQSKKRKERKVYNN